MNKKGVTVWEDIGGISTNPNQYNSDELEFIDFPEMPMATYTPDYWTRLEHQYAGMAMQGMLAGTEYQNSSLSMVVEDAQYIARALVEKYKKEETK